MGKGPELGAVNHVYRDERPHRQSQHQRPAQPVAGGGRNIQLHQAQGGGEDSEAAIGPKVPPARLLMPIQVFVKGQPPLHAEDEGGGREHQRRGQQVPPAGAKPEKTLFFHMTFCSIVVLIICEIERLKKLLERSFLRIFKNF